MASAVTAVPHSKGLVIILDGLGDRPCAVLGGATPLEAADTPNLDRLATAGQLAQVDPLSPGVPVGTHLGAGVLMGLLPDHARCLGRGAVEAAGAGLALKPGDVALRCNFATVDADGNRFAIVDRRAARIRSGVQELAAALSGIELGEGITATVRAGTQHRAVLRLSGDGLSAAISDTDPGSGNGAHVLECVPTLADDEAAARTADAVNRYLVLAHERLRSHPINARRAADGQLAANALLTRGAGTMPAMHNVVTQLGLRTALVTGGGTVAGLGKLFGFTVVKDPRFTAAPDTDLAAKIAAVGRAFADHDLVFLHVKGPDICAHDKDPQSKKAFLERFDDELAALAVEGRVVAVSADHSTDSNTGAHSGDPVPSVLYSPSGRRDANQRFDEVACMSGGIGRVTSYSFITMVLDSMGCLGNYKAALP